MYTIESSDGVIFDIDIESSTLEALLLYPSDTHIIKLRGFTSTCIREFIGLQCNLKISTDVLEFIYFLDRYDLYKNILCTAQMITYINKHKHLLRFVKHMKPFITPIPKPTYCGGSAHLCCTNNSPADKCVTPSSPLISDLYLTSPKRRYVIQKPTKQLGTIYKHR